MDIKHVSAVKHGHLETLQEMAEKDQIKQFTETIFTPDEAQAAFDRLGKNNSQEEV